MRRLIINADDFGLTAGVNRGILEAHRQGVVTSATMMANALAMGDAVRLAKTVERLSVGCHVVLIDGQPLLSPSHVRSLMSAKNRGRFRDSLQSFAAAALQGHLDPDEVADEVEAQIRKIQSAGLEVSHVDTHKHTHLFPAVGHPLLKAAKACGVRAVRNPFAPLKPLAFAHLMRRPRLWTRYSEVTLLRRFNAEFRRAVEKEGMVTTDGSFGIVGTGALDEKLFEAIVGSIPEGTWELLCHPGYCDEELRGVKTRLRETRAQELKVLTSAAARQALEKRGVELISYRELGD